MAQEIKYSNREIDEYFKEIKTQLNRIEAQTIKTNGRVTGLEGKNSKVEGWQTGIGMCLALIVVIIIPLLAYIWTTQVANINETIDFNKRAISNLQNK